MSSDPQRFERVEIQSADALWAWLETHHAQSESIWLVTWKAAHKDRYVSRNEVLDALIAYGWIDGRRLKLDEDRTMQMISPRQQQAWAQTYKDRAARLEAEGRMKAPGQAAILESKARGLWETMAHVDALEEPEALLHALKSQSALDWWSGAAPSYRRNVLRWIAGAKREETRAKRIGIVSAHAARGQKVPQY